MATSDGGRAVSDPGVLGVAACGMTAGAGAMVLVALAAGAGVRGWVEDGVPLAASVPVVFGAAGIAVSALVAFWSFEMARGSARAAHRAHTLLFWIGFVLASVGLSADPWFWAAVPAFGLMYLVGRARRRLSAAAPEPPPVRAPGEPVRAVAPGDLEAAAAERPYPYPAPLAPAVKRSHLDAVASWQRRAFWWLVSAFVGIVAVVGVAMVPTLWETDLLPAAVGFFGGLLLVGLGVHGARAPLRAKDRHIALLRAYGVRVDAQGREVRSRPVTR